MNLNKTSDLTHEQKDAKIKELDKHFCWAVCWIFALFFSLMAAAITAKVKYDEALFWKGQFDYEMKQQLIRAKYSDNECRAYPVDHPTQARIKELERQQINYEYKLVKMEAESRIYANMHQQCESKFEVIKGMIK